jgi:hypothetical protein
MGRAITSTKDGLPLVIGLLNWIRHLLRTVCAEETPEEGDRRHRLENDASGERLDGFERSLGGGSSGVVA